MISMYFGEMPQLAESSLLISSSFLCPRYPEFLDPFSPIQAQE